VQVPPRPHEQLGLDPLKDPHRKVSGRSVIHRNQDHAAKRTSKENGHPLGTVFAPNHHTVALCDPPRLQVAGKAASQAQDFSVSKRFGAISAPLLAGSLSAMCLEILQKEFR